MTFKTVEEYEDYFEFLKWKGKPIPENLIEEKKKLELLNSIPDNEYIFGTMKVNNRYMTKEKEDVVRQMTDQLLSTDEKAAEPCLLLGKVQCGKTDTFLSVVGLCFDRGIDIAVVMTKGTNTLTTQTLKRLSNDFRFFKDNQQYDQKAIVSVHDIMDIHPNGLNPNQLNDGKRKFIIVAKKEEKNLEHLIELFERSELMRNKRVLVCDDEADFASRAYYQRNHKLELLKIAQRIEQFKKIPHYCRYMQITATPYSLYLQPDGIVELREGEASSWLPRYTGLVPIHSKYVGGKHYFELSEDENSMYSLLFQPVEEKCMEVLECRSAFYQKSGIYSETLESLSYAVVSYMFAAAVRSLQVKWKENKHYKSSCLIHCELTKKKHAWQEDLISKIIDQTKEAFLDRENVDMHIHSLEVKAYESLRMSNELGNKYDLISEYFPSFDDVHEEVRRILMFDDFKINKVNSEEPVAKMLNEKGQLRLEQTLNFFIGGSILDRGITIDNMLCFFYGRDPKKFQMDTVLQHARMYGARNKEDMACTRFFTTKEIYDVLKSINDIDSMMYEYLKAHPTSVQSNEFTSMVIGYDKRVKASAQNKYLPANTKIIKPHQRILPIGFQTGTAEEIAGIIHEIDALVACCSNHQYVTEEQPFFLMDYETAVKIIHQITSTLRYGVEWENVDYEWDENEMLTILDHCTFGTDGMIYCLLQTGRNMSRERDKSRPTKGRWIDSPNDGSTVQKSKAMAVDRPVLILIRQNGAKEQGWMGAPFYWPVLLTQESVKSGIFTINGNKKQRAPKKQHKLPVVDTLPKEEILKLSIRREPFFDILMGEKTKEYRDIKETTYSLYLAKDINGKLILKDGLDSAEKFTLSSRNNGIFPFVINETYRYLYLRCSQDYSGSLALVELDDEEKYELIADEYTDVDVLHSARGTKKLITDESLCQWAIAYKIKRVIAKQLTPEDEKSFEKYKEELEEQKNNE